MKKPKTELGREIRRRRVAKGLSQKELGEAIGKSQRQVCRWEEGVVPSQTDIESLGVILYEKGNPLEGTNSVVAEWFARARIVADRIAFLDAQGISVEEAVQLNIDPAYTD